MSFNTISVIGLGYIGLPTAGMFASKKKKVIGVDVNPQVIRTINSGEIHIVEPDLDVMIYTAVKDGFLRAVGRVEPADAFLIAVPTPFKTSPLGFPEPDLRFIEAAAQSIAPVLKKGDLVVLESTCPVGATEQLVLRLAEMRADLSFPQRSSADADVFVAHCPERVLPGHVVEELVVNDRVIGGISERCSEKALELYKIFVEGACYLTDSRTAEMAKLTENSCRDVQIAFANELSLICDELGINVWNLIELANRHPRINILQPGPGVGGHCIAVDPWFVISKTPDAAKLIRAARTVNESKPEWVVQKVKIAINDFLQDHPHKTVSEVTVACFGLAFKPNIDDLRESPAMRITETIASFHSGPVLAVEPNIVALKSVDFNLVTLDEGLGSCDVAVMLVDHKEFLERAAPNVKYIVDTKGIW